MFLEPFVAKTFQSPSLPSPSKRGNTRLAKSRTSSHVFSKTDLPHFFGDSAQDSSRMAPASGQHTSDLRHMTRRKTSGILGEMAQGNHDTSIQMACHWNASTAQLGQALNVNQSSSTLYGQGHGQFSPAPEQQLDVGQAISLLQELKKTATPDELVALHRALLPTREVLPAQSPPLPGQIDAAPLPRMTRRRTVMPPGLATRAGFDEDLLRRPEEAPMSERMATKQRRVSGQLGIQIPKSNLVALDLADDTTSMAGSQYVSPAESAYIHTGIYRHGTLWVTNGSPTPEPSVVSGVSSKIKAIGRPVFHSSVGNAESSEAAVAGVQQVILSSPLDRYRQNMENQEPAKEERRPTTHRNDREARHQDLSGTIIIPSEMRLDKKASEQHKQHYQSVAKNAITPAKWADGPVSFPRLDQSPTYLSLGHNVDYDTVSNPSEDKDLAKPNISRNPSINEESAKIVHSSRPEEVEPVSIERPEEELPATSFGIPGRDPGLVSKGRVTAVAFDPRGNSRPKTMHHPDSGYGSDATTYDARNRGSREVKPLEGLHLVVFPDLQLQGAPETPTDSPTSTKKSSPFARLKSMTTGRRRGIPSSDPESPDAGRVPISPIGPRAVDFTIKETKKLQKPIPKAVLKQREAVTQKTRNDAMENVCEPTSDLDARISIPGPDTSVLADFESSPVSAISSDEDIGIALPDVGSSDDRGRPSLKPENNHRRQRSKTVHGSKDDSLLEPVRATGVSRMRSKSLGRNADHSPRRPEHAWDSIRSSSSEQSRDEPRQVAEQSDGHISTKSKMMVSELLSKRRSVPTLQFFQHERRYQIQPGYVMPKSGSVQSGANLSSQRHVRGRNQSRTGLRPSEQPSQRDVQTPRSGNGSSKGTDVEISPETTQSEENRASLTELLRPRKSEIFRPLSLQIGNAAANQRIPDPSRDRDSLKHSADPETRDVGAVVSPPLESLREGDESESINHDGRDSNYLRAEEHNRDHGTTYQPGSWQRFYQQPAIQYDTNMTHNARHSGWPGWERQAQLWRERRENAGANLVTQMEYAGAERNGAPILPTNSPHPDSHAFATSQLPRVPTDRFQDLAMNSNENRPAKADVLRTDSAQSTATFYSVRTSYDQPLATRPGGPRPISALSYVKPTDPLAPWSGSRESDQGYIRTPSGQYLPYRPENTAQPESSRIPPMPDRQPPAIPPSDLPHEAKNLEAVCDRFGGGLGFGWDRDGGLKGSAGFKANPASGPSASEQERSRGGPSPVGRKYGIDLSDVPLFVQKI